MKNSTAVTKATVDEVKLPTVTCLDLTTGHLTQETCADPRHHHIAEYEYGHFFSVPEEIDAECEPDLAVVLAFAQKHDCDLVRFDTLGEIIDELPYFDW